MVVSRIFMVMDKKEFRQHIRALLRGLSTEERARLSEVATLKLISSEEWKNASSVMLYLSMNEEIDTSFLIDVATREGKRLFVPRINGDDLVVCEYDKNNLVPGVFGILEPGNDAFVLQDYSCLDLVIVPGLAFTDVGLRLGRGKGYYDRFLPKVTCPKIALAFPLQVVSGLPFDEYDVRIDKVCY